MKYASNANADYACHGSLNVVEGNNNKNIVNTFLFKSAKKCSCGFKSQYGHYHFIKFKSSFSLIKPVIDTILNDLTVKHSMSPEKRIDLFIILSELFVNAIEHGNNGFLEKEIVVNYLVVNNILNLSVEDEGLGFDYRVFLEGIQSPGISLIKSLTSRIYWNTKGNKVYIDFNFN